MKISGTIITLNAEKYILRAVKSLKLISDEVIVLDSDSTDSTRKIAESAGAKVYIQSFLGDGPQKKKHQSTHQMTGYSVWMLTSIWIRT